MLFSLLQKDPNKRIGWNDFFTHTLLNECDPFEEENKLMDTIAKSGFTYSQTKQIFRRSGGKRLKHGDTVAGETFTTKDWRDILRRRITITKQVQRGIKGAEPIPPAPTKWDDEKYDSGYRITRSPGYQSLQK